MPTLIRPNIVKCISFLSAVRPDLNSFDALRKWVIDNGLHTASGITNSRCYVPFYTSNAIPCKKEFGKGYLFADKGNHLDGVLGMKLMHGVISVGDWGNNSYTTYLHSDFTKCKTDKDSEKVRLSIDDCTMGGKFYFFVERQPNHSGSVQFPQLVIVVVNIRFQSEEIICLPVQIRTNGCYFGGHGGETKWDITYRKYTKREGWKSKSVWSEDSFRMARDIDIERKFHEGVFDKVVSVIS